MVLEVPTRCADPNRRQPSELAALENNHFRQQNFGSERNDSQCAWLAMFDMALNLPQVASYKLPSVTCHACAAALWAAGLGFISFRDRRRRYLYLSLSTEKLDTKRK